MATNHIQQQRFHSMGYGDQQFVMLCGPSKEHRALGTPKLLREHPVWSVVIGGFCLFLLENLWSMYDYVGATVIWQWRSEILAGIISLLTLHLYVTFRSWQQEREQRANQRHERVEEFHSLLCTPPPLTEPTTIHQAEKEYFLTIERWASQEPYCWSEKQCEEFKLPDEFLAPDALVLNVEWK